MDLIHLELPDPQKILFQCLMPVVQDMIKTFYIEKPVTCAHKIISLMYTKKTLWIGGVSFPSLDNAW